MGARDSVTVASTPHYMQQLRLEPGYPLCLKVMRPRLRS